MWGLFGGAGSGLDRREPGRGSLCLASTPWAEESWGFHGWGRQGGLSTEGATLENVEASRAFGSWNLLGVLAGT